MTAAPSRRRQVISTGCGLLVGGLAYFLTLFQYGTDLTRTALAPGYFSQFFDVQGRALLAGKLAVPDGSLSFEGFIHDGHTYMYFPPWPAILRLPVLMTTHEYDGRLTLLSMVLAWVVLAVMSAKLVWLLMGRITGHPETTRGDAVLAGVTLAMLTGGTTLTFDASLPWVYHEVYVWAVAAAIAALYWLTRFLYAPDPHAVWWLFVAALVTVGSRATEGFAVCLVTVAVALWLRWRPPSAAARVLWWRVLLAGAVPLACSIAVNEAKFGSVYAFPLQSQVFTTINQHRQDVLAANGGSLTGPQFFWTSLAAYLRPDGVRFVDVFPWITLPAHPAPALNGAVVDQSYRTGSATALMPLLLLLLVVAVLACFRPRARPELALLRWPLLAGVLTTGGVMSYGYYAYRYTSEFVPALAFGGAVGAALLARWLGERRRWRAVAIGVVAAGTAYSLAAQMAIGLNTAAVQFRGPALERYVAWQHDVTPTALAARTFAVDGVPTGGSTDDLAVRGNCDALYLNTGDHYEPWVEVEARDQVLDFSFDADALRPGQATVLDVTAGTQSQIDVQVDRTRRIRFVIIDGATAVEGPWFDPPTTGGISLGVRDRLDYRNFTFEAVPGGLVGVLPSVWFDDDQVAHESEVAVAGRPSDRIALSELGMSVTSRQGFPLTLCQSVARAAGLPVSAG